MFLFECFVFVELNKYDVFNVFLLSSRLNLDRLKVATADEYWIRQSFSCDSSLLRQYMSMLA